MYAGEDIECIITFKNIANVPGQDQERRHPQRSTSYGVSRQPQHQNHAPSVAHSRASSIAQSIATTAEPPAVNKSVKNLSEQRGHRPTLSLNVANTSTRGNAQSAPLAPKAPLSAVRGHGRSLSIMSMGSDQTSQVAVTTVSAQGPPVKRPGRAHSRSTSLQTAPRSTQSPYVGTVPPRQPSPLYESETPPALAESSNEKLPVRPARRKPGTVSAGNTPQLTKRGNSDMQQSPEAVFAPTFQFPGPSRMQSPPPRTERSKLTRSPPSLTGKQKGSSPRPAEGWTGNLSNLHPITRVMSESSKPGTSRTSSEFYSLSNHSEETLTSEMRYNSAPNRKLQSGTPPKRAGLTLTRASSTQAAMPETLIMGYAQTMGFFTLDGSLVNAAPFEEVKRKGVQGDGGVIGLERTSQATGMFGAFSWGSIGESLGGLLGADDQSSMAQMKASAGSKSIPLLSSPQNLLFVDLRLAPGESKSFTYRFPLPRGLPPTTNGRAVKVVYHLSLGVQRPQGQTVKHIEVPFRVLGSYNARGETMGHDLMSPYILLQDPAKSQSITPGPSTPSGMPPFPPKVPAQQPPKQGLEEFLRYTERLLEQSKTSHEALTSPTSPETPTLWRKQSQTEHTPASVKEAVDFAILRANYLSEPGKQSDVQSTSPNRFNIARDGQPVAVVTLLRPAFRLGEAVIGTVDFAAPQESLGTKRHVPTYSLLIELESSEEVDPSLALRSSTSIHRVTRRIHAAMRENTLFARQTSFSLTIPTTAAPTFETTGVSLVWRLRLDFTTERQIQGLGVTSAEDDQGGDNLLEELGGDERGTVFLAKERLPAETFEVSIPIKVLGAAGVEASGGRCEALEV